MGNKPKHEGLGALTLVTLIVLGILVLIALIWGLLATRRPINHNPANAGAIVFDVPHHPVAPAGPSPF